MAMTMVWLTSIGVFPIQDTNDRRGYHIALQRRTNQPPVQKLTLEEFTAKTLKVEVQINEAFCRDPDLKTRAYDMLGLNGPALPARTQLSHAEFNNVLRQAGYKSNLFPEDDELEDYSVEQIREHNAQIGQAVGEIRRTIEMEPDLTRRFGVALGLNPEGSWPQSYIPRRIYNTALRDTGYRGPLFPANPGDDMSDPGENPGSEGPSNHAGGPEFSRGSSYFSLEQSSPYSGPFSTVISYSLSVNLCAKNSVP